jgi:osmotically-inducible protein OsmY
LRDYRPARERIAPQILFRVSIEKDGEHMEASATDLAVSSGNQPVGQAHPGAAVLRSANHRLRDRLGRAVQGVRSAFADGTLRLAGELPTFYQKQLAQEAVRRVDGVRQVVNDIVVIGAA